MSDDIPDVSEADVIRMIYEHIAQLFPKTCPRCKRTFVTYRDYLQNTKPIGRPVSYDIEAENWKPSQSTGNLSLANCQCGNTLAISSQGMPLEQIWQVLKWIKNESERRKVETRKILEHLRIEVTKRGLA